MNEVQTTPLTAALGLALCVAVAPLALARPSSVTADNAIGAASISNTARTARLRPVPSDAEGSGGSDFRLPLGVAGPGMASGAAAPSPDTDVRLPGDAPFSFQPEKPIAPPAGGGDDSVELSKKLANPVASLVSVPFQFNYDNGYGPKGADRVTLNIQPVIPFSISEDWNLILRTIVPVIYQGSVADGVDSQFGLGDTVQSFFFSPKEPIGGWILAAGPVALWPTGTSPALRSEQLGLGPTVLALRQESGWTYGILANHIWGMTQSDDHPDVNATFLQPFVSYTWSTATSLTVNSESTYDWTGEQWTVPLNAILGQVVKFGKQPVQFQFGGRYYADKPAGGPEWGLRFGITFLFPK